MQLDVFEWIPTLTAVKNVAIGPLASHCPLIVAIALGMFIRLLGHPEHPEYHEYHEYLPE